METEILKTQRKDVFMVDARLINIVDNFNVRQDMGDIDNLTKSIKENGVRNPIRCYKDNGDYFLIDGHRRMIAVNKLLEQGVDMRVPVLMEDRNKTIEQRMLDMLIYNDGKPLTMIEEAEAVKRLLNYGYTEEEIAQKIGKSRTHINNLKMIMDAPPELKSHIQKGTLTSSLAIEMMRKNNCVDVMQEIDNILQSKLDESDESECQDNDEEIPVIKPKDVKGIAKKSSVQAFKRLIKIVHKQGYDLKFEQKELYEFIVGLLDGLYDFDYLFEKFVIKPEDEYDDSDIDNDKGMGEF